MAIRKRGRSYQIDVQVGTLRIRETAGRGATLAHAKRIEAKLVAELTEQQYSQRLGRRKQYTASAAFEKWLTEYNVELKSRRKFASHLAALEPYLKGKKLTDLPDVATLYRKDANAKGLAPATINRRIALIRRVLNLAHKEWDWIDQPIAQRVRLVAEHNTRHVYEAPADIHRLAEACTNSHARDLILLAAYSGLRRSELLSLSAENVAPDKSAIVLGTNTKTGRPRIVPVPKFIQPILKRIPIPLSDPQLRKQWELARAAVGKPTLKFHDLRHSYASWLLTEAGASLITVRDLLGHTTVATTNRYAHLLTEHLRAVTDKLPE